MVRGLGLGGLGELRYRLLRCPVLDTSDVPDTPIRIAHGSESRARDTESSSGMTTISGRHRSQPMSVLDQWAEYMSATSQSPEVTYWKGIQRRPHVHAL